MKGFKNTKTGPIYVGSFPTGATPKFGDTMPQRFAAGGLVSRTESSNALDEESGGKTPLRPGYNRGGKAKRKYAEGGKVGKLKKAAEETGHFLNRKDIRTREQKDSGGFTKTPTPEELKLKREKAKKYLDRSNDRPIEKEGSNMDTALYGNRMGKLKYAEGGKVGALLKAKPAIKAMRDRMAKDVKADKVGDPAGYKTRREAFFESRKAQRPASSGPATRDTRTGRFAKGGMVGCGFNRKPMIGK